MVPVPQAPAVAVRLVGVAGAVMRVALQEAVEPPFTPAQLQVYVVALVATPLAVPALQSPDEGGDAYVPPLELPQLPATGGHVGITT